MTRTMMTVLLGLALAAGTATGAERSATTTSADGTTIHYTVQGEGAPAVVFIHGWSCDGSYWRNTTDTFAGTHRVVVVDLAGHGESGQQRQDYTVAAFGQDVVAVMEAEDIADAVLVGHSMGGPVAVEAALAAPDRVRGVVGIDTFQDLHPQITEAQIQAFTGAMKADFQATVTPWVRSMFAPQADSALVAEVAADMASAPPAVGVSAMGHTLDWFVHAADRLAPLKVNLTTVSGELHPTDAEGVRAVVPGFKVRTVPGAGHFLMLEKPEAFNTLLAEAVAEFGPRRPD